MEPSVEYLQRVLLTVDYEPVPDLFDKQGRLISFFMDKMPKFELGFDPNTRSFLRMRSSADDRNLHIGLNQFTCFVDRPKTLDIFSEAARDVQTFLSATNIESLTRLGALLIYRIPVEFERFMPLSTWYDIPGIQDPRLSGFNLIHYQINLQKENNRMILTFGQQHEEGKFYRTINLHYQCFGGVKAAELKTITSSFIGVLLNAYEGFQREE